MIAAQASTADVLQLAALLAGIALLVLYLAMRIRGKDLLPRGPAPTVPFRIIDAVGVGVGSFLLQVFTLGVVVKDPEKVTASEILTSYAGPVLIAFLVVLAYFSRTPERREASFLGGAVSGPLAWLATFPIVAAVLWATTTLLRTAGVTVEEQEILTELRSHPVPFFLVAVVMAPFVEEVTFRGLLYPALKKSIGVGLAMVTSAALFSLVHWHLPTAPAIFALGLALAYVYERTGTLAAPIAFHAMFNGWTYFTEVVL